jgi:hypothetical protein
MILTDKMTDYSQGKIYAIRSPNTDKYYIGSTATTLCKRFYDHKIKYTNKVYQTTSCLIFEAGEAYIELIELYPCDSKVELNKREGELQRENKEMIVNKNMAHRTPEQNEEYCKLWKEQNKEAHTLQRAAYYQDNKEEIIIKQKAYVDANKEAYLEYHAAYYEANKADIAIKSAEYRSENKEKISEKNAVYRANNVEKIAEYQEVYKKKLENIKKKAVVNKAYREANKEQRIERDAAYYEANREAIKSKAKDYYHTNKEAISQKYKARYAAKKQTKTD